MLFKDLLEKSSLLIVLLVLSLIFPPHLLRLCSGQVFAIDFNEALGEGKSLGSQGVETFNPQRLNQTLEQRGLGPSNEITPRVGEAQKEQGNYTGYYSNPGGMSGQDPGDAGRFVQDSYEQRPKFDLTMDPTFGSACLERDSAGRCIRWSGSKDLITTAYPNCQKVVIPQYDNPPYQVTCTGTNALVQTPTCELRSFVSFQTETIYTPCQSFSPGFVEGQIYAVCKDYYDWYRIPTGASSPCGHTPIYFTQVNSVGELPSGAVYMFRRGSEGSRYGTTNAFDWYVHYKHSILERMILTQDSTCGSNIDRWLNECTILRLEQCDLSGTQCIKFIENGEETGQVPPPPLVKVSQGEATVANCDPPCWSTWEYSCDCEVWTCPSQCTGNCPPSAVPVASVPPSALKIGEEILHTNYNCLIPERTYETIFYYQNPSVCQSFSGSFENYSICLKGDFIELDNGTGVRTLSRSPVREDFSCSEFGVNITMFRLYGGPEVREALNYWVSRVTFSCESETGNCQQYIDQGCVEYSYRCLNSDCTQVEYTYNCGGTGQVTSYRVAYNCLGDLRCMGTDCVDASYEANTDFVSASAMMEVLNQYRNDSTENSIFPGERRECQIQNNCCRSLSGGVSIGDYVRSAKATADLYAMISGGVRATWYGYANTFTYFLSMGEAGSLQGLLGATVSDALGTTTTTLWGNAAYLGMTPEQAANLGIEIIDQGATYVANVSMELVSALATIATVVSVAMAVYSIVTLAYNLFYQCHSSDIYTATKTKYRLCHYVGTRCAKKVLGICLKKNRVYCCFNSILARIVHEQGRAQLGIGWGSAESPNCRGLMPGELGSIDFSRVDLREYMQYIEHQTEISPERMEEIMNRVRQKYQ